MKKYLLVYFFIGLCIYLFALPEKQEAGPASSHYELKQYGFGSGSTDGTGMSSTHYTMFGSAGEIESSKSASANYRAGTGLLYTLTLNLPPSPTLSNPGTTYDRLKIVVNQGGNASDILYAMSISTNSTFASNVAYVKSDMTMGTTLTTSDYKLYSGWGGSGGFFVTGLKNGTTYYVRARARVSTTSGFAETQWSPISSGVATANSSLTFNLSSSSINFNPLNAGDAYTDATQTTVMTTSTNAYNGYVVYAKETQPLMSGIATIANYPSLNSSPSSWSGTGFGYTTNDSLLTTGNGSPNRFNNGTSYAGFIQSVSAGDPVADDLGPVQNNAISNEQFTISYRVTANNTTPSGTYKNVILYTIMATY